MSKNHAAKLRVHFVTQDDPLYVPAFFAEFFRLNAEGGVFVTGVDATPLLNQANKRGALRKALALFGYSGTLRIALQQLASKARDLVLPPGSRAESLARLCKREHIPYHVAKNINSKDERQRIAELKPDVLLSIAASQIFRPKLLSIPSICALNIHNGKLPRYRGMLPVFWQLFEGRDTITISVHMMDASLDTGQIVIERSVAIGFERSLHKLFRLCKIEAAHAAWDALGLVSSGRLNPRPQPVEADGYFTFPTSAQARELRSRGYSIP